MATTLVSTGVASQNTSSDVSKRFVTYINNNPYRFNIGLATSDGRYQELRVGAINNLVIDDMFVNFYHSGYIILNNTFDAVERITEFKSTDKLQSSTNKNTERGYLMRGDSRDLLIVDIMPIFNENDPYNQTADKDADEAFKMSFIFSVYNTEEIMGSSPGQKFKKLYFWDIHYELLREKNSYFSTANSIDGGIISAYDDYERGIYTGDAIKNFLTDFFKDEDGWPIKIGNIFDQGSTTVFFSSPAGFKGIDCLEYLLSRHASSIKNNFDQSFLRIERNTSNFNFESLSDIFKKALANVSNDKTVIGSSYIETFKLGAYSEVSGTEETMTLERVDFTPIDALFFDKYGTINNFSYDPMPGEYSQSNLATIMVHSYDFGQKQFQIDQERNSITATLSTFKDNYVSNFSKASKTFTNVYENIFPGDYRLLNKNVRNVFTVISDDADQRLTQGRNKALFNSIFFNSAITFRVPGSPSRQAGHFIGINYDGASSTSEFNKKLLGIYFVISVKHIFSGNEYFNEIRCVKTYNYDKLLLGENSK